MLKIIAAGKRRRSVSPILFLHSAAVGKLLFFLLFAGILLGCIFTVCLQAEEYLMPSFFSVVVSAENSLISVLFSTGKYFFLIFLAATSYLGLCFIPALVFLRGCAVGSAVASFYTAGAYAGLLKAFTLCGVTELLALPGMMSAAEYAFHTSRALLRQRLAFGPCYQNLSLEKHYSLRFALLILLSIIYQCALLPLLHI